MNLTHGLTANVSNQLISLTSREGFDISPTDAIHLANVSNQLISLTSREEASRTSITCG
jgi:hypothetical protein